MSRVAVAIAALTLLAAQAPPEGFETVQFDSEGRTGVRIAAYLKRPVAPGPAPAVVAAHGCGGLFDGQGRMWRRDVNWAERLVRLGYAVLLPDSFHPRGFREICTLPATTRRVRPRDRALDVAAAASWLAQQPFIDKDRIALIGWSHGGSTVLSAARSGFAPQHAEFKTAIAFYPGCRTFAGSAQWAPRLPITILIGSADDWTPPEPCRALARQHGLRLIEYPDAVHAFDAPNSKLRTRSDVGTAPRPDGLVTVGTDPVARMQAIDEVTRILAEALR